MLANPAFQINFLGQTASKQYITEFFFFRKRQQELINSSVYVSFSLRVSDLNISSNLCSTLCCKQLLFYIIFDRKIKVFPKLR